MGRKIICPSCNTVFDEDVLKARNSENVCLVCNAALDGGDDSQAAPKEELIDWYYYQVGKASYYLDDKFMEDNEHSKLVYKFQAPNDLDEAKKILRRDYKPDAFMGDPDKTFKTNAQWIAEGKCPKCHSSNITIVQRKWSPLTGFRTNKTDRVCVNCKHRF